MGSLWPANFVLSKKKLDHRIWDARHLEALVQRPNTAIFQLDIIGNKPNDHMREDEPYSFTAKKRPGVAYSGYGAESYNASEKVWIRVDKGLLPPFNY